MGGNLFTGTITNNMVNLKHYDKSVGHRYLAVFFWFGSVFVMDFLSLILKIERSN